MDRNGIAAAVTSISAPGVWFGDIGETGKLARLCNDYAAEMKRDFPGRFGNFAILPLPDVDSALREIEYALDTLGAEGVGLMTNYGGRYPGDPLFRPVLEELDKRKAIVFVHPTAGGYANPLPEIPIPTLEFPFETTRAVTSLLYGGVFSRYLGIRFVFSHAGGVTPYLAQRIARLTVRAEYKQSVPDGVLPALGRLCFDTALSANAFAFDPMRRLVPVSNILFGTDYPHAGEPTMTASLRGLDELELSNEENAAVKRNNAMALFPRLGVD
jgi:predicted TIM-barrel fold metal-dependent hydrolase